MVRKIFLSILGISCYKKVKYFFEEDKELFYETNFIQEATIKYFVQHKNIKFDEINIFLTSKAKKSNWENPAQLENERCQDKYDGLSEVLNNFAFNTKINNIDIPDGNNEQELWQIFQIIYDTLEENDEIYLDVTHSFRSLPIFLTVLLNYAKTLKNIKVKAITYGNWEARDDQNFAPVIELISVNELQNWTIAANNFIKYGTVSEISLLIKEQENFSALDKLVKNIYAVRGQEIIKSISISAVKKSLKNNKSEQEPFNILKQKILNHISSFKENKIDNGFVAVEFCIKHNLIQQGITLLEEFIITKILSEIGYEEKIYVYRYRNVISKALENDNLCDIDIENLISISDKNKEKRKEEFTNILEQVFNLSYKRELTDIYKEFAMNIRNDINHAGFRDNPKKEKELKNFLEISYQKIEQIFNKN